MSGKKLYSFISFHYFIIPFTLFIIINTVNGRCPSSSILSPCKCIDNNNYTRDAIKEIICSDINESFDISTISKGLEYVNILRAESIVIRNTSLKHFAYDTFKNIKFKNIIIRNNRNLQIINPHAFEGSVHSVHEISIINNPKFTDSSFERDIWDFVSKFPHLKELEIRMTRISSVVANAFRSINGVQYQLKHVDLSDNQITEIGDYAFSELTSGWFDINLSGNRIRKIGTKSLKYAKPSEEVINSINLSGNQLDDDSFESDSFRNLGRPIGTLYLRRNQLSSLNEDVFLPLFGRSLRNFFRLEVESNPIVCDCKINWLFHTKYCYSQETPSKWAMISDQISGINCLPHDFQSCKWTHLKSSPSCGLNVNFASNLSVNSNFMFINILLLLFFINM